MRKGCCATYVDNRLKLSHAWVDVPEVALTNGGRRGLIRGFLHAVAAAGAGLGLVGCTALASAVVVFHLGVRPVLTGSMRPAYGPGAILITKQVAVKTFTRG